MHATLYAFEISKISNNIFISSLNVSLSMHFFFSRSKISTQRTIDKTHINIFISMHFCFSRSAESTESSVSCSRTSLPAQEELPSPWRHRRRASTYNEAHVERTMQTLDSPKPPRKRSFSFHEQSSCRRGEDDSTARKKCHDKGRLEEGPEALPSPCTCPYFGESSKKPPPPSSEIIIVSSETMRPIGNRGLEMSLSSDTAKPVGAKTLEVSLMGDTLRPILSNKNLETGLLGRNNSAKSTDGAGKGYEQLTLANSVVTWRGGRRGSSLGT